MTKERINISIDEDIAKQMRLAAVEKYGNSKSFSTLIEDRFKGVNNNSDINGVEQQPVTEIVTEDKALTPEEIAVLDRVQEEEYVEPVHEPAKVSKPDRIAEAQAAKEKWLEEYMKEISTKGACVTCTLRGTHTMFFCNDCKTDFEAHHWAKFCPFCSSANIKMGYVRDEDTFIYQIIDMMDNFGQSQVRPLLDQGKTFDEIGVTLHWGPGDTEYFIEGCIKAKIKEFMDKGDDIDTIAKKLHTIAKKLHLKYDAETLVYAIKNNIDPIREAMLKERWG